MADATVHRLNRAGDFVVICELPYLDRSRLKARVLLRFGSHFNQLARGMLRFSWFFFLNDGGRSRTRGENHDDQCEYEDCFHGRLPPTAFSSSASACAASAW